MYVEMESKKKAILYMLLSAGGFVFMQFFIKISASELPLFEQVFIRDFFVTWIVFFIIIKNKKLYTLKINKNRLALLFRCLAGFSGSVFTFYALRNISLADSNALQKTTPFFVMILSAIFLKEKLNRVKIISIVIAFLGVILIIKPTFQSDITYMYVALLGALIAAIAYTLISHMKDNIEPEVIIFYFTLFSSLSSIPLMIKDFVMPDTKMYMYILLIGISQSVGQIFMTLAYKYAPAGEISIYTYSNMIISLFLGYFILGESIDLLSFIGIILITLSGIYVFVGQNIIRDISKTIK